jgi:hypothetical protein
MLVGIEKAARDSTRTMAVSFFSPVLENEEGENSLVL